MAKKAKNNSLALITSILLGPLIGTAVPTLIFAFFIKAELFFMLSAGAIIFAYLLTIICLPTARRYYQEKPRFIRRCTLLGTAIGFIMAIANIITMGLYDINALIIIGILGTYGFSCAFITALLFKKLSELNTKIIP